MPSAPTITTGGFTKPVDASVLVYNDANGDPVPVTAVTPMPVTLDAVPGGASYTDGSGVITLGGTAQQVFAANTSRRYLFLLNPSDTAMYVNFGTTAVAGQPSIILPPGGYFEPLVPSAQSVSIICATTGKTFAAKQA